LAKKRKVVNILVDNDFNNEAVCKHSFFNNGCRHRRSAHSGFLASGTRTFFALDDLHEHFDGVNGEAFAAFVADELFVLTAPDAGALARGQSDDAFLTGQIFWQRSAHRLGGRFFLRS
jgi:hypothetical protein